MKSHSFLLLLIIVQIIVICYMVHLEKVEERNRLERANQLLEETCRMIEDGYGKDVGKLLTDIPHSRRIANTFDYLESAFADLKKNAPPSQTESEELPAETVPAMEGGEQP
ncbi:MAG: hypothetical protein K5787_16790 [Lentisphaeria bacterium]|nr:hypothetical protein [Victivallales bacterium]MCR4575419.1 hypothetical protein [Lentisphaeria bacterium]